MSKLRQGLAVGALALTVHALPSTAQAEVELRSDSGIEGPAYADLAASFLALKDQHAGWVSVHDYGTTPQGRVLRVLKIESPARRGRAGRPAVLISGSTHGDEYLNIEDRLPAWFLENRDSSPGLMRYLDAGGVIYLVPILNPDGYENRTRGNSRGVDLNRDFDLVPAGEPKFSEPETKLLADWLDREITAAGVVLKLTVDYHCCNGSLLFPWSYTNDQLPADKLAGHVEIAQLMQQDIDPSYVYGSTGPVLGYLARGTSKDYYFAKYDALAFTYEGDYGNENRKFPKHTLWWDHILSRVAN